ncbi:MAG: CDP-alcohol phosphatidyltransferase family protein [Oscillospiraceae bacterium]|nr:CDP-alcohol phosphatidyltransferase family protein [Oscillospiraceae bacterium]
MIGFYDYTVWLTYASLLSAGAGIVVSLSGLGHPYMGMFFLLFSGFCDAFDGIVARSKKNRTPMECNYGIQIDSLADVVAFGVLPACIGVALMRRSELCAVIFSENSPIGVTFLGFVMHAILMLFMLAALIRLAYFNVTEEERQKTEGAKVRKEYTGLPVTSSALIFPTVLLADYWIAAVDLTLIYFSVLVITGFCFLGKFKVRKPSKRGVYIMVAVGAVEFFILLLGELLY